MKKKVIHIGILAVIFVAAVIFFEYITSQGNDNMMADIGNATLPRVYFSVDGYGINPMNGYVDKMDVTTMRDGITPVTNNQLVMNVEAEDREVSSIDYAVYTIDGETKLYENQISNVGEQVNLSFEEGILDQERVMIVTLHSEEKEYYYYTRVVTPTDFNVSSCLDYVYNYHENALAKKENVGVGAALEPNDEGDNTTFSHVTIHSDYDQVTWGSLEPQVTGGERWKILETNASYTSVLLEYEVNCKGEENETDLYTVKEFFRVRMAAGTMYLLNYDRTMEQIFDGSKQVLNEKGVLLGITAPDVSYAVNSDGTIVSFVQANELWNYNRDKDEMALLFSFRDAENADIRNKVSDHSIQILGMDKEGNTTFAVSGYMNRGNHEGQVGVDIYYYDIETNSIEEKAFIPSDKAAAVAVEELGKLTYYSTKRNYLYMMVGGSLYEVDVDKNLEETVASDLKDRQYATSENGQWIAWQTGESVDTSSQAVVRNLYNGEEYTVEAGEGECIVPLGFVGGDFVYGLAKQAEVGETISGELAVPMYRIEIRDDGNEVVKTYDAGENYVLDAQISDGMITLNRAKKSGNTYTEIDADYIANNEEKEESNIMLESYITELKETQMRLTFLDGIKDKNAKVLKPKQVLHDDPALPSFEVETSENGYYVYGIGKLQGIYRKAGTAIQKADSVSGVVIAPNGQYVWERGNRYLTYLISGQDELLASLQSRLKAGTSALDAVNELTGDNGVELTSCSTEQVLYLINKGTPVIGVRNGASAVILIGYDENNVTFIDVSNGQQQTILREQMDQMMQSGGNAYIGYLPSLQ
ncbi:MAG: hypothetical protein Q4C52_12025 [Eubacteriales bacterium]|nr:hypothetical protein [Eubacteriales bacterium]